MILKQEDIDKYGYAWACNKAVERVAIKCWQENNTRNKLW